MERRHHHTRSLQPHQRRALELKKGMNQLLVMLTVIIAKERVRLVKRARRTKTSSSLLLVTLMARIPVQTLILETREERRVRRFLHLSKGKGRQEAVKRQQQPVQGRESGKCQ